MLPYSRRAKNNARSTDGQWCSNIGKNRVRGFELSTAISITDQWDIWAGWTYLDPKIVKCRER